MSIDRRKKSRLGCVIPLKVRGLEKAGKAFCFQTVARDIGAGGLCAYAPRMVRVGDRLSMRVRFARPGNQTMAAPEFSIRGRVVRTEIRPTGLYLFAVSFLLPCN